MREIKFRAWDNKKKEWLFGYELPNLGGFSLFGETVLLDKFAQVAGQFMFSKNGYEPDDLKITQYTGLKDKKGKEIYEGDLLDDGDYDERCLYKIVWNENKAGYEIVVWVGKSEWDNCIDDIWLLGTDNVLKGFEVIGNIYSNPELLNNK